MDLLRKTLALNSLGQCALEGNCNNEYSVDSDSPMRIDLHITLRMCRGVSTMHAVANNWYSPCVFLVSTTQQALSL